MKSLVPVLLLGVLLAAIVFTARFTKEKIRDYAKSEQNGTTGTDPNSAPNDFIEQERLAELFPDSVLTSSGLRYRVLHEGTGPKPIAGSRVKVHYRGRLLDGTVFDSSFERGEPIEFTLMRGEVIRGWDQALLDMRRGETRLLIIPSKLAYGEKGHPPRIPPRATLLFEVELVDF